MRVGLLACGLWIGALLAQQPTVPTFRAAADLVWVDVSVLDKQRHPVRGLTAGDFAVREDGKARNIAAFTAVDLALPAPSAALAPQQSASTATQPPLIPEQEGRLVIIMMDRSIPIGQPTVTARNAAKAAVAHLAPTDLGAVVFASAFAKNGTPQDFTTDRAKLVAAIDSPFLGLTVPPSMPPAGGLVAGDPKDNSTCYCGVCLLEAVTRVANAVRDVPLRRKNLMLIAGGAGINIQTSDMTCANPVDRARTSMLDALRMANLTIYGFDPVGLETHTRGLGVGQEFTPNPRVMAARTIERQNVLFTLAEQTGGRAITNTNDPAFYMDEVFAETDFYYLVGFSPGAARDGRTHKIDVSLKRSGVNVRARRGYVAR